MALEFLGSQAFKIAEERLRDKFFKAWLQTSPDQEKDRERLWMIVKTFETMKGEVKIILDDAEVEIENEKRRNAALANSPDRVRGQGIR